MLNSEFRERLTEHHYVGQADNDPTGRIGSGDHAMLL